MEVITTLYNTGLLKMNSASLTDFHSPTFWIVGLATVGCFYVFTKIFTDDGDDD